MKKTALIFLVFIYAFTTTGVAVKGDYCCNNLESVKLVLADGAKDKEGCCKVKYQSLQIKDAHAGADIVTTPALPCMYIYTCNYCFPATGLACEKSDLLVNIHAPPLHTVIPVYISNCVFRI